MRGAKQWPAGDLKSLSSDSISPGDMDTPGEEPRQPCVHGVGSSRASGPGV